MRLVLATLLMLTFAPTRGFASANANGAAKSDAFELAGREWQACIEKAISELPTEQRTSDSINHAAETLCKAEREQVKGTIGTLILQSKTAVTQERIDKAWEFRKGELTAGIIERLSKVPTVSPLPPIPTLKGDVQRGLKAYNEGDYMTALARWLPKAKAGDAAAQNNMGLLYEGGLTEHTPQSDEEAANWFSLAAAQNLIIAMQNLARVQTRLGRADLAQGWINRAAELQSQQAAAKRDAMGALGYALGCALGGGCGSNRSYSTQSSVGSVGLGTNSLRRQYYQNGSRMCVYANGTIFNAGLQFCPQSFGNR